MKQSVWVVVILLILGVDGEKDIDDNDYYKMANQLSSTLDCVTGYDFVMNWINILSDNVTVCYPFVGIINQNYCLFGLDQVKQAYNNSQGANFTSIQQEKFYISKYPPTKIGVWYYSLSSSYLSNDYGSCSVLFDGVVNFSLDPANTSLILKWLETPDSNRINQTYPCKK